MIVHRIFVVVGLVLCTWYLGELGCSGNGESRQNNPDASAEVPVIKPAPDFHATTSDGEDFDSRKLRGTVWVASFMFTNCMGVCPVMNTNLMQIQDEFAAEDVRFVSISVDPDVDTREVLAEYAAKYKARKGKWYFVRMALDSVRELSVKGFLLSDPVEPAAHSPRFVLVDRQNEIRGYYDSMDSAKVVQLRSDLRKLLVH